MAVDKALETAVKAARGGKPMQFAFFPKGTDGVLLVDKTLPPKTVADKKKQVSASTVFRGRVVGEDGTLFFEVAQEPPPTLKDQLTKSLKVSAGQIVPVEIRVRVDAEVPAPPPPPPPATAGPTRIEVLQRLNRLGGAVKAALKGPDAARVQALVVAANGLLKNDDAAQASRTLDELEPLLGGQGAAPAPAAAADEAGKKVSNVVFTQSRLVWDATRKKMQADLKALEQSIRETCRRWNDDPDGDDEIDLGELEGGLKKLPALLEALDTRLIDKLDEALNAADADARQARHQEAKAIVAEYLAFVNGDRLLARIDDNGFLPSKVRANVQTALTTLAGKL